MYTRQQRSKEQPLQNQRVPRWPVQQYPTPPWKGTQYFSPCSSLWQVVLNNTQCVWKISWETFICAASLNNFTSHYFALWVFFPLLLPQELAGLFPFFATNISNCTCETTRGRQKSHGLSYRHLHPCWNLSSCQFCICLRTVFHSYYKVVSLLGRRGKVKVCFDVWGFIHHWHIPMFLFFLLSSFPPIFNTIRLRGTGYGLQKFESLSCKTDHTCSAWSQEADLGPILQKQQGDFPSSPLP